MNLLGEYTERLKVLITGGGGFIGGAVIRKLLKDSKCTIYNLDKMGYASDLTSINNVLLKLSSDKEKRHKLLKVDLTNSSNTFSAVKYADPDLIMHLAAESHVDRSITGPEEFIRSNILGTFNLLEAVREHYENLTFERKKSFKFHHISTDEVFGSLGKEGKFNEESIYDPRSPYSASKASSDHLVKSWHHTFGIPVLITTCSNNYGPWQDPEKLIPKIIINALNSLKIPIYGTGENIRDWIFVEDHAEALINVLNKGEIGEKYCIGGNEERSNMEVAKIICNYLDEVHPRKDSYKNLITYVEDRKGHDFRYAIKSDKIKRFLNWHPRLSFKEGIKYTIDWYYNNKEWCKKFYIRNA